MENTTNSAGMASGQATSYDQDSMNNTASSSQSNGQGGMMSSITGALGKIQVPDAVKNVQLPQAVKDFGATCSRSYNGLSTTQKVLGGAALLGATYWAASSNGWMGLGKSGKTGQYGRNSGTRNY